MYTHSSPMPWAQTARVRCFCAVLINTLATLLFCTAIVSCSQEPTPPPKSDGSGKDDLACAHPVTAEVVALEQIITYNRFGAFNPAGMVFALRRDVVYDDPDTSEQEQLPLPAADKLDDETFASRIAGRVRMRDGKRPRPLVLRVHEKECLQVKFWNLLTPSRSAHSDYRRSDFPKGGIPRHAVQTTLGTSENWQDILPSCRPGEDCDSRDLSSLLGHEDESDFPATRSASIHVNGLDYAPIEPQICQDDHGAPGCQGPGSRMGADGANVGNNPSSLVAPGRHTTYRWYARQEGGFFMYSAGALAGGEGDGGQLGLGLFGSINVEPEGSVWYRSQVTHSDLQSARRPARDGHEYDNLDYRRLTILNDHNEIVHSDLNAIIHQPDGGKSDTETGCADRHSPGGSCGMSFREFTVIFHDENKVFQAFAELSDQSNPLSQIADGMAVNYGSAGVGSAVLAAKKGIGPARDCPECKLEEFFLTSWANGDPALILLRDQDGKALRALYDDDPSNVHHAYLGDPVRFRNIHAGPKETHVFHLHAHQWLQDKNDPDANYLDSQTISPGSSYTYDIQYGGGGNRNLTPGDAIFHCHLYPHFAAGMWELWRNHDVFEDGKPGYYDGKNGDPRVRNLPDAEIAGGTPNPAVVPIPGYPLAPLPTADFRGYPFYIPGEPGHRPPQPPLDMAHDASGKELNGGLPRHVIAQGGVKKKLDEAKLLEGHGDPDENLASRYIAERTWKLNSDPNNLALAQELEWARIKVLPQCGTREELIAMAFHAGWGLEALQQLDRGELPAGMPAWCADEVRKVAKGRISPTGWFQPKDTAWPLRHNQSGQALSPLWEGMGFATANAALTGDAGQKRYDPGTLFRVNGYAPAPGAPYADPCPARTYARKTGAEAAMPVNRDHPRVYKAAYIQFDMTVNKYGWHDPQARMPVLEEDAGATLSGERLAEPFFFRANSGECVQFQATNLIPSVLNLDDFQVYTPTDTIGQHIHLVKFDVTASDGSANGWNYEDGTFAPDEVRERIEASHRTNGGVVDWNGAPHERLEPRTHAMFLGGGSMNGPKAPLGRCLDQGGKDENPWCGAQSTVQRWWADPVLDENWDDRTLRAVFTHDHYGPSSHQQHGFYAALVVEPRGSVWTALDTSPESASADCQESAPRGKVLGGDFGPAAAPCRGDGGPTSFAANIGFPAAAWKAADEKAKAEMARETRREYNLAFADFAILYNADLRPVNPPSRQADLMLPQTVRDGLRPKPEGISTEDPGTRLLNYRNEPIPLRIAEEDRNRLEYHQKRTPQGDMANVFSSRVHAGGYDNGCREIPGDPRCAARLPNQPPGQMAAARLEKLRRETPNEAIDAGRLGDILRRTEERRREFLANIYEDEPWRDHGGGDPSTPVLAAYEGEPVKLQLIQGAQEEQHVFSMTGMKWLAEPHSPNSGYMNGQQLGISEHFEFDTSVRSARSSTDYWLGSPAVENLWDGMWGILRSYGWSKDAQPPQRIERNDLARLPEAAVKRPPFQEGNAGDVCPHGAPQREFQVGTWLARDLLDDGGLTYNARFGIRDRDGILFVQHDPAWLQLTPVEVLQKLRQAYAGGKKVEPLVLRASAGDCIIVNLANFLPKDRDLDEAPGYNLMPPIINGFNFNQVRMSSRVGLQPQLLDYNVMTAESAIVGLNVAGEDSMPKPCRTGGVEPNLSACGPGRGKRLKWYAGDRKVTVDRQGEPFPGGKVCDISENGIDANSACDAYDERIEGGWIRYTPVEFGVLALRETGDVIKHSSHGAVGALVVEPAKAKWPESDYAASRLSVTVTVPLEGGEKSFREFVVVLQDDLTLQQNGQAMPNHRMADDAEDTGQKGFNYRSEPLWARNGLGTSGADFNVLNGVDYSHTLSSMDDNPGCAGPCGDPGLVFEAPAGADVRFRVVHPGGHSRQHAFALYGHNWEYQPWDKHSTVQAQHASLPRARIGAEGGMGPARHANILTSAGGTLGVPGDYLFRVQEQFQFQGGMWGIFRVTRN